jgi:hypothetical protein
LIDASLMVVKCHVSIECNILHVHIEAIIKEYTNTKQFKHFILNIELSLTQI